MQALEISTRGLSRPMRGMRISDRSASTRFSLSAALLATALMLTPRPALAAETPEQLEQWRT
jgi:hypothetical protein